jgi:predicted PolB exonuclease-like 3'-5' exonuclease
MPLSLPPSLCYIYIVVFIAGQGVKEMNGAHLAFVVKTVPDTKSLRVFAAQRGVDPAELQKDLGNFLPPVFHRIVALGLVMGFQQTLPETGTPGKTSVWAGYSGNETELLRIFFNALLHTRLWARKHNVHEQVVPDVRLVTFGGRRFNLPVILARSLVSQNRLIAETGQPSPHISAGMRLFMNQDRSSPQYTKRFSDNHVDLMEDLSMGARKGSLGMYAAAMGIPGAPSEPADIANLCMADRWEDASLVAAKDAHILWDIYVAYALAADQKIGPIAGAIREISSPSLRTYPAKEPLGLTEAFLPYAKGSVEEQPDRSLA